MRIKAIALACLVGALVLSVGYEHSRAELKAGGAYPKIGTVSVRKIFQNCKRSAIYREQAKAEHDKAMMELQRLSKELEADRAGLKTLKAGSSDHLAQMKEILEKQASLEVKQEFLKQEMLSREQRMIEELYGDVLRVTREVAEQKALELVFERSEPELSAFSSQELKETIGTHKLLYSGGCLDITDEVMARLDAM